MNDTSNALNTSYHEDDVFRLTGVSKQTVACAARRLLCYTVEYVWHGDREFSEQTAFGVDWGYRSEESTRSFNGPSATPDIVPGTSARLSSHTRRDPPPLQRAPRLLEMEFDDDLFDRGVDDTVSAWQEERVRAQPYVWVYLSPRYTARATVRFERRKIDWTNTSGQHFLVETDYATALVGLRAHFGSRRQSIIEGGFASEFRKRREQIDDMSNTTHHDDHRFYFSFEYVFDDSKRLRIIEALELDGEDIGDLRNHDHGFLQMIFGF